MTCQCSHMLTYVLSVKLFPSFSASPLPTVVYYCCSWTLPQKKKNPSLSLVTTYCAIIIVIHTFRLPIDKFCCEKVVLLLA